MVSLTTRRAHIKQISGAFLAPYIASTSWAKSPPSERVRHASFGGSGMAGTDLGQIKTHPNVEMVAVAEIDPDRRRQAQARLRGTKIYSDWREMLNKEGKNLDSVNVSTPDHVHACMGMSAMQMGLHVYGQKPLAHDVYEVRRLTEYAKENKLITQMGIQIHSAKEYRTAVKLVHDGVIGKIVEAHSFSGKRWGDANPKPNKKDPVPEGLDCDAWIGPAPYTDYISKYYHPGQWRKRLDYGTGTFGDMGCHIYDPTFKALGLTYPISLRSEGPKPNKDNWGFDAVIHYTFPGNQYSKNKTLPVTWYDGTAQPPARIVNLLEGHKIPIDSIHKKKLIYIFDHESLHVWAYCMGLFFQVSHHQNIDIKYPFSMENCTRSKKEAEGLIHGLNRGRVSRLLLEMLGQDLYSVLILQSLNQAQSCRANAL